VNADAPEQRIDGALRLADHRPNPPPFDRPLLRARLSDIACPAH
jgi:hypothetical protein